MSYNDYIKNYRDDNGNTLAHLEDLSPDLIKPIINVQNHKGQTPLISAAKYGNCARIKTIIKCNPNFNIRDNKNRKWHHYLNDWTKKEFSRYVYPVSQGLNTYDNRFRDDISAKDMYNLYKRFDCNYDREYIKNNLKNICMMGTKYLTKYLIDTEMHDYFDNRNLLLQCNLMHHKIECTYRLQWPDLALVFTRPMRQWVKVLTFVLRIMHQLPKPVAMIVINYAVF